MGDGPGDPAWPSKARRPSTDSTRRIPLRIAILVERFAPGLGGVENVAWQVAHGLARDAWNEHDGQPDEVTVLTRAFRRDPEAPEPEAAPTVQLLPVSSHWQPWRVRAFDRATARIAYAPRSHGSSGAAPAFDIVHSFSRTRRQDLYRAGGGSHADYLRRNYSAWGQLLRKLSPRHRTLLAQDRAVFRDPSQRIQCSSRLVAQTLTEHEGVDPQRIWLIPNAVDPDHYGGDAAQRAGAALRAARFPMQEDFEMLWLFPGSGWHRKGLAEALLALTRPTLARHRLWVAGRDDPAPWKKRAEALGLAERVDFIGAPEDLAASYHAVDAVVLPTRYDPFANVTLEAAAAGKPIVTSAANGAGEWLGEDLHIVGDPTDADALAAALADYASAERRAVLGERLAQRAASFSWAEHIAALRAEYQRIAIRRAQRSKRNPQ